MKHTLSYLLLFSLLMVFAESKAETTNPIITFIEKDTTPPDVFNIVDEMPCFGSCTDVEEKDERKLCSDRAIINFINENVIYPPKAREKGIEGTAVIRFYIDKDGTLLFDEDLAKNILRNPGEGIGEEALRVMKLMPKWVPGKNDGKNVKVQFTMPVKFQLDDKEHPARYADVKVKFDDAELMGKYKEGDLSKMVKTEWTLSEANAFFSKKSKGLPVSLIFGENNGGYAQYFLAVGPKGKKYLIDPDIKNKTTKKNILKALKSGETIYFYNWEYKRRFLEILIK